MNWKRFLAVALAAVLAPSSACVMGATIPVVEDVMTSAFFQGADTVRGYPGDNRPTLRISSNNAFGTGPEAVYLTFAASDPAAYAGPVTSAVLSVESVAGGFSADATPLNPFQMSAHMVTADPLTSITDDDNPGGLIAWTDFLANNVVLASEAATTTVTGSARSNSTSRQSSTPGSAAPTRCWRSRSPASKTR